MTAHPRRDRAAAAGTVAPIATAPTPADPATVAHATLWHVRAPLRRRHVAAHGTVDVREVVLVSLHGTDGVTGWGECDALPAPTYTGEWVDGARIVLRDHLLPGWLAGHPPGARGHPMATCAVAVAAIDLALRRRGQGLAAALGATRSSLPVTRVVSGASIDDVLAGTASAVDEGVALVKVKIHPGHDLDVLAAVRSAHPTLRLAADANGSYGAADAERVLALDRFGLEYLEQPLPADALVDLARVAGAMETPVAVDESATGVGALTTALALGSCRVVNVKPARVGGVAEALAMADLAADAGVSAFVGGMLELGVGRATALAVAALDRFGIPTDVGPSSGYVDDDVTDPVVAASPGHVAVPAGPGVGVTPRPDRLAALAVDRVEVHR